MSKIEFKIEKVKNILDILSKYEEVVFRGGTALFLSHNLIKRNSEDIDFSILKTATKKRFDEIIESLQNEIVELEWVTSCNNDKTKNALIIEFINNGEASLSDSSFDNTQILLEYPNNQTRRSEGTWYSKIYPYKDSANKMNVMKAEEILIDKIMIIYSNFLKKGDFSWVSGGTNARHIYDFFILWSSFKEQMTDEKLLNAIKLEIITKDKPIRFRKKFTWIVGKRDMSEIVAIFNHSFEVSKTEIIETIDKIVYPNAKIFKPKRFLIQYKELLSKLLTLSFDNIK